MGIKNKSNKEKKSFFYRPTIWILITLLIVLCWPLGLMLLFMKLTDMRDQRENSVPLEEFLSYSAGKTKEENEESIRKERSYLRSITATKFIVPILTIVGGIGGTRDVIYLFRYGFDSVLLSELMRYLVCLILAFLFACYAIRAVAKRRRFQAYMNTIRKQETVTLKLLAEAAGCAEEKVESDLEEMISLKYFESSAHIDATKRVFCRH